MSRYDRGVLSLKVANSWAPEDQQRGNGLDRKYLVLLLMFPLLAFTGCSQSPTSPGGSGQWVKATSNAFSTGRYGLAGTVFNGSMWAVGGASGNADGSVTYYYSDVYSSGSGASWSKVNASAPFGG